MLRINHPPEPSRLPAPRCNYISDAAATARDSDRKNLPGPVAASSRAIRLRACPPMLREITAHQNFAIRLKRDCITEEFASGLKAVSSAAVRIQPGNAIARDCPAAIGRDRCKAAADENLAIRLDNDDANRTIRVRIETVERGLRMDRRCHCEPKQRHHHLSESIPQAGFSIL